MTSFLQHVEGDEQVYTDFQSLNAFDDAQLSQFIALVLSFLEGNTASMPEQIAGFAQRHGVKQSVLRSCVRSALVVFKAAVKASVTAALLKQEIAKLGTWQSAPPAWRNVC